jgi:hypothetical protein
MPLESSLGITPFSSLPAAPTGCQTKAAIDKNALTKEKLLRQKSEKDASKVYSTSVTPECFNRGSTIGIRLVSRLKHAGMTG